MHNKETWQRRRTWGVVVLASVTLIATSAPEPAYRTSTASKAALANEVVQFSVAISEDGVDEATGLTISVMVSIEATPDEPNGTAQPVIARLIPDDAALGIVEIGLFYDILQDALTGKIEINPQPGCDEDKACKLGFSVEIDASRAYDVEIQAQLTNTAAGCLISNPSFSDDATISVVVE